MVTRVQLEEKLLYQFKSDHELVQALEELNLIFTKERHRLKDYVTSEKLVSAYVLFYAATNMPKLSFLLEKLPQKFHDELRKKPLIDFGSGPGTFLMAWKDYWEGDHWPMFGVESQALMRKQAQNLLGPDVKMLEFIPTLKGATLLFGHSANELESVALLNIIHELDPETLIFIEPGTKEVFQQFLKTRKVLLKNYDILYPCSAQGLCPLEGRDDWCHQIVEARHDSSIERITQLAHRDRRTLPTLFHVFVRKGTEVENNKVVVTRVFAETKFSFEFEVCLNVNGANENRKVQIMKKTLEKSVAKRFEKLTSGHFLEIQDWTLLNDGRWRVAIA